MLLRTLCVPIASLALSAPAGASGTVLYVGAGVGELIRIDLAAGGVTNLGPINCGYPNGAMALRGTDLLIGQRCGQLVHFDTVSRRVTSTVRTVTQIYGLAFDGTSVLVLTVHPSLVHLDPATGEELDGREISPTCIAMSLSGGTVFTGAYTGAILEGSADSGPLKSLASCGTLIGAIAAKDGTLLVGTLAGDLLSLDAATGAIRARFSYGEAITSIAVDEQTAYLGATSGTIRHVELSTGAVLGVLAAGIPADMLVVGPSPCRADLDGDGAVTVQDFLAFLGMFAAADPAADLNADGATDVADFLTFLAVYAAGCP